MSKTKAVSQNQAGGNCYKDPPKTIFFTHNMFPQAALKLWVQTPLKGLCTNTQKECMIVDCWGFLSSPPFSSTSHSCYRGKVQRGHRSYANNQPKHPHHFVRVSSFGHRREIQPEEQTIADICSQRSRIGVKTQGEASPPQCWLKSLSALYPQPHAGRHAGHVHVSNICVSIKPISRNVFYWGFVGRCSMFVAMIWNYGNWTGCGFVGGWEIRQKERNTRSKAEENDRKADFMLGGLHLICFQREAGACVPARVFTAT